MRRRNAETVPSTIRTRVVTGHIRKTARRAASHTVTERISRESPERTSETVRIITGPVTGRKRTDSAEGRRNSENAHAGTRISKTGEPTEGEISTKERNPAAKRILNQGNSCFHKMHPDFSTGE